MTLRTLILPSGEDINTDHMDLSTSVLSGLRGGHIDDLAREFLNPIIVANVST